METITKHEIFIRHNLNSILSDFVQCVFNGEFDCK